jgi:Fic family protein
VPALMDDFVNQVNRNWGTADPVVLATYVLWRLNYIHPFINGNGRTARAACYFILCIAAGGWLRGDTILPELIRQNHNEYTAALVAADQSLATGTFDMSILHAFVSRLLNEQLMSAQPTGSPMGAAPNAQGPQS